MKSTRPSSRAPSKKAHSQGIDYELILRSGPHVKLPSCSCGGEVVRLINRPLSDVFVCQNCRDMVVIVTSRRENLPVYCDPEDPNTIDLPAQTED